MTTPKNSMKLSGIRKNKTFPVDIKVKLSGVGRIK
jgi:hypothetical protein